MQWSSPTRSATSLSTRGFLARSGRGVVITDDAYPDAHRLAEAGWLERRFSRTVR
jgi:hypothetical protein